MAALQPVLFSGQWVSMRQIGGFFVACGSSE
jgi:hypothetical protein